MIHSRNHSDAHSAQGKSTDTVLLDDAQLHGHPLVFNSTCESRGRDWKALHGMKLGVLNQTDRTRLAACLRSIGFHTAQN
jgi:hypothetical protein